MDIHKFLILDTLEVSTVVNKLYLEYTANKLSNELKMPLKASIEDKKEFRCCYFRNCNIFYDSNMAIVKINHSFKNNT